VQVLSQDLRLLASGLRLLTVVTKRKVKMVSLSNSHLQAWMNYFQFSVQINQVQALNLFDAVDICNGK
jgi:hypothetical protein